MDQLDQLREEYKRWVDYSVNRLIANGAAVETIQLIKEEPGEFAPTVIKVLGEPIVRVVVEMWKEQDEYKACVEVQERRWD